jgi:DHA2 family lincomycin resistance protein-like MFS transporter
MRIPLTKRNPVARKPKQPGGELPILIAATFVLSLNETVIAVAIPSIMSELAIDPAAAQWVSSSFMLAMAIVIPTTGFLLQRMSARVVFVISMSLFTLGTAIGVIAIDLVGLLVARSLQGAGAAIMFPLLLTTVMRSVPANRRGRTMGNLAVVMAVAPAIGPGIGGTIIQVLDWRFLFILILPVAILALALTSRVHATSADRSARLDVVSVVLSIPAFAGLVLALSAFGSSVGRQVPIEAWVLLGCGTLALTTFVLRQLHLQKHATPFLDLSVFTARGFSVSVILMVLVMAALFGVGLLLPIYMQDVLGLSPAFTGLLLVAGAVVMGLAGPLIGRLVDRVGPRPVVVPGILLVGAVLWAMTGLSATTPWELVLAADIGLSLGIAAIFTPINATAMRSMPPRLFGQASSTIAIVQQLGGAAGSALFVGLFSAASAAAALQGFGEKDALVEGVRLAFGAGALVSIGALVVAFLIPRVRKSDKVD